MPEKFDRYFEPFAGGLALFFRVAPTDAVISDANADLIALYTAVATDVTSVIKRLQHHRAAHDEKHYYATRERWNQQHEAMSAADRAATFIYLNKTCFNGLWRVNRSGDFNVPIGRYSDPPICVPEALHAASALLARTERRQGDYRDAVKDAARGDFVYFDPPYDPHSATSNFVAYSADGFTREHQQELADTARTLVARGVRVMLSNNDTTYVRSLYKGFKIASVKCSRAINSNAAKRGDVDEVIVTGGY